MRFIFFGFICLSSFQILSGQASKPGKAWFQNMPTKDTVGIDLVRAYTELLSIKTGKEIIVAVIDGGTDISHPDLSSNIWHNPAEIPFNNSDDDQNGYIDDTVGWNFIGGKNGEMVEFDNLEKVRIMLELQKEFDGLEEEDMLNQTEKLIRFNKYKKLKKEIASERNQAEELIKGYTFFLERMEVMRNKMGKLNLSRREVKEFPIENGGDIYIKNRLLTFMRKGMSFSDLFSEFEKGKEQAFISVKYNLNPFYNSRKIVGDVINDDSSNNYGNNNVNGPDASHGTHVAGIIAAVRNNNYGINGVADHVKIMVVRVVPHGDERDKDVANGIRYAVNNGAKIINMSFGKEYSWNKSIVNEAVSYAVSKGVLLVHAAGNDNKNIDVENNYPNDSLGYNRFAESWVEIGASALKKKGLAASFSNYGKNNVDVFAPGYQIYSTIPNSEYDYFDGTSMAAPVASGVAALVWSYYPSLTAVQIKQILIKSATVYKQKVPRPGGGRTRFKNLSVSGGVINVFEALLLASELTNS